jgi:hypothetical protein
MIKVFISPLVMKASFSGYSNQGWQLFSFRDLTMSSYACLAFRVSFEKSAIIQIVLPLYVSWCFSLAVFNIISLFCILNVLIII